MTRVFGVEAENSASHEAPKVSLNCFSRGGVSLGCTFEPAQTGGVWVPSHVMGSGPAGSREESCPPMLAVSRGSHQRMDCLRAWSLPGPGTRPRASVGGVRTQVAGWREGPHRPRAGPPMASYRPRVHLQGLKYSGCGR